MNYSNARITRGNDFRLVVTVLAPDYEDKQAVWDSFDLTECKEIHASLICEKDQVVIPLEYTIKEGTTNVLICPVKGAYLHAGASYGIEVKGVDKNDNAWRWKLKGKEAFSIVDNTSAQSINTTIEEDLEINAFVGLLAEIGPKGETGDKGPTGDPGPQGETGDKGPTGDQGPQGETGDKGLTGDKGEQGDKGLTGDKGPTGNQGPQGIQGSTGDKGPTGDQGPQGIQGDQGIQGPQGDKGLTGDKGPTGDKGATGDQGEKGLTGDKGEQGDKGETGDKGLTGDRGPTGQQGPQGEKGLTGDKGATGDKGPTGDRGPLEQADWNETGTSEPSYIKNKPNLSVYATLDYLNKHYYNGPEADSYFQYKITAKNKLSASLVDGLSTVATSGSYNDLSDKPTIPNDSNLVHKTGAETIAGNKTFSNDVVINGGKLSILGSTKLNLTQSSSTDKPGFTVYDNNSREVAGFQWRPNTIDTDGLLWLGHYNNTSTLNQTYIGFRNYTSARNSHSAASYHLVCPLPFNADDEQKLHSYITGNTFHTFFFPLGFTDGTHTVLVPNNGLLNISNIAVTSSSTPGLKIEVVSSMPQSPDKNTLYIVQ